MTAAVEPSAADAAVGASATITLHHLQNSRSQRILWLLEELGIDYQVKRYERGPDKRAPKELEKVHPLGKSPVITDGSNTVAESGAILEYLVEKYGNGRFRPAPNTPEAFKYTYWLHFAEGSLMPPQVFSFVLRTVEESAPFLVRRMARGISGAVHAKLITPDVQRMLAYVESELATREWFAGGDFSAADIMMSFPLETAVIRFPGMVGPRATGWLERIHARPAYKAALEKGGKYDYV